MTRKTVATAVRIVPLGFGLALLAYVATRLGVQGILRMLVDMRWSPALLEGRPVCELTRSVVVFTLDYMNRGYVKWKTRLVF